MGETQKADLYLSKNKYVCCYISIFSNVEEVVNQLLCKRFVISGSCFDRLFFFRYTSNNEKQVIESLA